MSLTGRDAGGGRLLALPILLASLIAFAGTLTGGALYYRDITLLHRPVRLAAQRLWGDGLLPLWQPGWDGGRLLLANPNHRILHPTALLDAIFSVDAALAAALILQVFLAGWGLALWLADRGAAPSSARAAGIAFALSGPLLSLGNLPNLMAGMAWVPLILWAGCRALQRPRPWLALACLLGAVPLFAGGLESLAVALAILALWAALEAPRLRRLATVTGIGLGSFLVAAIQVIPTWAALAGSERGLGLRPVQIYWWSMPPQRLLEMFVPRLWGVPTDHGRWWGDQLFDAGVPLVLSTYLGIGVAVLALMGVVASLRRRRPGAPDSLSPQALPMELRRGVWVTLGLGGVLVFLALGRFNPLLGSDAGAPVSWAFLRFPERLLPLAVLGAAVAAAAGWEALRRSRGRGPMRTIAAAALGAGALWMLLILGLSATGLLPLESLAGISTPRADVARASLATGSLIGLAVLAALAACCLALGHPRRAALGAALLPAVLAVDLLAVHLPINPTVSARWLAETPEAATFLMQTATEQGQPARLLRHPEPRIPGEGVPAGGEVVWARHSLTGQVPLEFGLATVLGSDVDRLGPAGNAWLRMVFAQSSAAPRERIADRAGANWEMGFAGVPEGVQQPYFVGGVFRGAPPVGVWRRRGAAPRVSLVPRGVPLPLGVSMPAGLLVEKLGNPALSPAMTVFLSGTNPPPVSGRWDAAAGEAQVVEETPTRVVLEARAPGPGVLVLRDSFAAGWTARIGGNEAPIWRADLAWRGVVLPPGDHQVVFTFRQPGLGWGAALSGLGLLLCGLVAGPHRRLQADLPDAAAGR